MLELLLKLFPHFDKLLPEFIDSIWATCVMVFFSSIISFVFGVFFGVILVVTRKDGILENKIIYNIIDKIINIVRSIPFIIFMMMVIPISRAIVGTAIGVKGAIIPLTLGTVPFFSRQIETALSEVDNGLIEAAQSMGSSPIEIIFRVYLRESIPSITRVSMVTLVNLIGLTAMAGALGSGGLGDFAIRYGHQRNMPDMIYSSVLVILLMVSLVQMTGNIIIKKTTH